MVREHSQQLNTHTTTADQSSRLVRRCSSCSDISEHTHQGRAEVPSDSHERTETMARQQRSRTGPDGNGTVWKNLRRKLLKQGGNCGLCNEPVDVEADWRSPWAPQIDHIVPRAQGGTDTLDNLQLSHRACNRQKSSGIAPKPKATTSTGGMSDQDWERMLPRFQEANVEFERKHPTGHVPEWLMQKYPNAGR